MKPTRNLDVSSGGVGGAVWMWRGREGSCVREAAVVGVVGPLPLRRGCPDEVLRGVVVLET
jgi:hypothetical protein